MFYSYRVFVFLCSTETSMSSTYDKKLINYIIFLTRTSSWVDISEPQRDYRHLHLEDEVFLLPERDDAIITTDTLECIGYTPQRE